MSGPDRRAVLAGGIAALAGLAWPGALRAEADPFAAILDAARTAATRPYHVPASRLPVPLDGLNYDRHRAIQPRPGGAADLDLGGGLRALLLPPGWLFDTKVEVIPPGATAPMPFDPAGFDFAPRYFPDPIDADPARWADVGYSGLRVLGPLNHPERLDEVLVLQGASYFRALARNSAYGLSARALGLGTGGAAPEEFPAFTRIALGRPGADGALPMAALVDGPSATAAFLITLRPGAPTVMDCALHLFPRVALAEAGIAPLTSMFFFGPMGPPVDDFRPAVHDSDMLWIENGAGEALWRPLANPAHPQMSGFVDTGPRRFGLLQTPREPQAFSDPEAAYHRRPSAWVEPLGDWGAGAVMLLELPTRDEYADNIAAFWRPARPLAAEVEHRFAYRLVWADSGLPPGAGVVVRRSASGIEPTARRGRLYVIDWAGLPTGTTPGLTVQAGAGEVTGQAAFALAEAPGIWRTSFVFEPPEDAEAVELRATLAGVAAPVWLHRWTRARDGGR